MIYLNRFDLMSIDGEDKFLMEFRRICFDSYYPMRFFTLEKELNSLDFGDITIFCGGNGSGKSTLLNIIAEKLGLNRERSFNKTYFFDPYLQHCHYQLATEEPKALRDLMAVSRIITSDDVFDHILDVRHKNENLSFKRNLIFEEKRMMFRYGDNFNNQRPRSIDVSDPESIKAYTDFNDKVKKSASALVRDRVGVEERTYSNGENAFRYFTDAIQPGGLYLLDEPENSLSAEIQIDFMHFLYGMARSYNCQFIMSSHSPFILSVPGAMIYNMDAEPVVTCRWTDLPNIRAYNDFFNQHQSEFE